MSKLYKIGGRVFRLDGELYTLAKSAGVKREDIEREYNFMTRITPNLRVINYNHAAYSAYLKKTKGKVWP